MLPRVTKRQSVIWWGSGGVLLLFAVTGLIGALVKPAQAQKPWRVSVTSASVSAGDTLPLQHTDPANRWVVVQAKVEIVGAASQTGLASMVRLSGVDGVVNPEPKVILLRDRTQIDRLHPGLPEELAFAWEQAAAATPPQRLSVQVSGGSKVDIAVTPS
jgi:hypothetical protein